MARAPGRRPHGRRVACCRGRLRLPRRRDVLRRRRPAPGVRLCRPAALDAAPVGRVGRPARCLTDRGPRAARHRDGPDRGADRAHRARPGWVAPGADPGRDHGRPVRLPGRGPSRHHHRSRPARLGRHRVAAGEASRRRRPAPLARAGRRDRDRPREQGHAPVPGRGAGGGTRPRPSLGCHPLALGVGGPRDRPPDLGSESRLAGD